MSRLGMSSVSANAEKLSPIRLQWVEWSTQYTGTPTFTDIPDIRISVKVGVPVSSVLRCTLCQYSRRINEPLSEFSVIGLLKLLIPNLGIDATEHTLKACVWQRFPSRLSICRCRTATEDKKLLPRHCRAVTINKKLLSRCCRAATVTLKISGLLSLWPI